MDSVRASAKFNCHMSLGNMASSTTTYNGASDRGLKLMHHTSLLQLFFQASVLLRYLGVKRRATASMYKIDPLVQCFNVSLSAPLTEAEAATLTWQVSPLLFIQQLLKISLRFLT